ncbi:hypothetical protein FD754_005522 [Muntiacus muntjak]|uniref:Calsyntenin C-terminal domain-containing protein n=1 Tax=Muntiacus muntjak TaxID=9888 RepID=A0A5N3WM99_MUNMU|nr:hypothetical protein FD754_005522 [Muntiacus muntjak]
MSSGLFTLEANMYAQEWFGGVTSQKRCSPYKDSPPPPWLPRPLHSVAAFNPRAAPTLSHPLLMLLLLHLVLSPRPQFQAILVASSHTPHLSQTKGTASVLLPSSQGNQTLTPLHHVIPVPHRNLWAGYHPAPSPDLLGVVPATHPVSDVKESKPEDPAPTQPPPSPGRHAALQSQPARGFYVAIRPESTAAGSGPCHLLFFLPPFPRHAMLVSNLDHTAKTSNQLLKLKLQYFGHLMQRADSLEKSLIQEDSSLILLWLPRVHISHYICDKEWHYYVINVEFPVVTLYMDGATYEPYLVTNDWPIHPSHIAMQLTYHFNPSQSVLVMEGDDIGNINRALQKVSYINSRQFPTAGVRRLKVSSKVQCFGEDVCISIPDMDAYVMVLQAVEPQITLHGTDHFWRPAAQFESTRGVILFPDIKIVSTFAKAEAPSDLRTTAPKSAVLEEMLHNLDFCDILVLGGDLDPRQECLELNHSELHQRHLDATNSTAGYSIYGVGSMSRYEQVLRHIRYRNWRPAALESRRFRIKCSELNGRYTSNEFNLEVSVLHEVRVSDTEHVNHLIAQPPFLQSVHHPESQTSIQHSSVVPSIATVVIIISVCMLVFVVAMGVYRVRIAHQHFIQETEAAKEAEMDWDDSALTITVNPMEKHGAPGRGEEETEEEEEEEEAEEDLSSSSSESEGSDEEEEEGSGRGRHGQSGAKKAQLEWDDSTLPY